MRHLLTILLFLTACNNEPNTEVRQAAFAPPAAPRATKIDANDIVTDVTHQWVTTANLSWINNPTIAAKSIITDTGRLLVGAWEKALWNSKSSATVTSLPAKSIITDTSRMFVSQSEKDILFSWRTDTAHMYVTASQIKRWDKTTTFVAGMNVELKQTNDSTITISSFFKTMNTAERDKWTNAPEGTLIINSDTKKLNVRLNGKWPTIWSDN